MRGINSMATPKKIIDISPRITEEIAVFPGDTPFRREVLQHLESGHVVTLSTLHSTVHLGAHADGPNHYGLGGRAIDEQPLDLYIGPCQVVRARTEPGRLVTLADFEDEVIETERLLINTNSYPDPENWTDDFCGLDPELVDQLGSKGVRLVGVDTPSVDPADSKNLPAHERFHANDVAIIEGLVLSNVDPGPYELIALPLRLVGFDGSPVRAILRTL